jgi:hypothetical protein
MRSKKLSIKGEQMNNTEVCIISKYVTPTKYDKAPLKCIWKVIDQEQSYIQVSEDQENPQWIEIGSFLQKSFGNFMNNKNFVDECFRAFIYNNNNPLNKISDIIRER